jgi:putative ABC transport system permease protein
MAAFSSLRVAAFLGRRAITRGNRGIIVLTVALMAVIYAELLFVPSLIQGATERIQLELRDNVTANIMITPIGTDLTVPDPDDLLARARATPGVIAATSTVLVGSQISYHSRINSWPVLAVDPKSYAHTFTTPRSMIEGTFLGPGATNEIVLGVGIAGAGRTQESSYGSSLQTVNVGDKVTVTLRGGNNHVFTVKGIYETDLDQANTTAFISTAAATNLIPPVAGESSSIYVRTRQIGGEEGIIDQLRHQRPKVRYQSWQALASSLADVTGSFASIKSILNAVSLFVAAISVFIVTYVDLVNKRRTMGVERAIGISGPAITASYGLKAVVFAVLGVAFGAGLFFGGAMPLVDRYPFQFPIGPVTLSVTRQELQRDAIILIVVAVVGALVPAWRAVRVHLLKAIWG